MQPSEMLKLIQRRRVVRRFDPGAPVADEALARVLEAAIWAPISVYEPQGWKFIALRGKERDEVASIVQRDHTILKYIRFMYEQALIGTDEPWREKAEDFGKTLGAAPVLVVCLVRRDPHVTRQGHNLGAAWCAAQNMMLQAEAEQLSSGVVSMGSPKVQGRLIEHLGFDPDDWVVAFVMNLGHRAEKPEPLERSKQAIEIRGQ